MNYRFQEIMKMVVPGFLLIIFVVLFNSAYMPEGQVSGISISLN